jgi:dynein heavy chain 2, cytosolic
LQSVAKIDRVLSSPRGSLLLCGKAGAGRKSAVLLVSLMHGAKVVTLSVTADYTTKHFKKELKAVRKIIITIEKSRQINIFAGYKLRSI